MSGTLLSREKLLCPPTPTPLGGNSQVSQQSKSVLFEPSTKHTAVVEHPIITARPLHIADRAFQSPVLHKVWLCQDVPAATNTQQSK